MNLRYSTECASALNSHDQAQCREMILINNEPSKAVNSFRLAFTNKALCIGLITL